MLDPRHIYPAVTCTDPAGNRVVIPHNQHNEIGIGFITTSDRERLITWADAKAAGIDPVDACSLAFRNLEAARPRTEFAPLESETWWIRAAKDVDMLLYPELAIGAQIFQARFYDWLKVSLNAEKFFVAAPRSDVILVSTSINQMKRAVNYFYKGLSGRRLSMTIFTPTFEPDGNVFLFKVDRYGALVEPENQIQ